MHRLGRMRKDVFMVTGFRYGNPIETGAVVASPVFTNQIPAEWTLNQEEGTLSCTLKDEDIVYGLGETVRGINKRGWLYISANADEPFHLEDKHSLYASQNFLMISAPGKGAYAVFVDTPGYVRFDVGYTKGSELVITIQEKSANLYFFNADSCKKIVHGLRGLTGPSYIPPKWAFGYGQSRWSYENEEQVRKVVDDYDAAGIALDSVYLDIDYMDNYKDFTVDEEKFPNFPQFVEEMKQRGIHLVPIIDAGVKIEEGYDVYEEGVAKDLFVKKADGSNQIAAVWPGKVHFPDFLKPEAREWFGGKYKVLLDQGIDGFWNDMNEPAIFYIQDQLDDIFKKIEDYKGMNLDIKTFFEFKSLVGQMDRDPSVYESFYHNVNGEMVRHDKVHNVYGFNMTRAAGEAFERLSPDKRILMFSRSSYIGMHRYGGLWEGDNRSWWSHLLLNLQQQPALNMCGFLYSGADIGGFLADTTEDLLMRWFGVGLFTPLMRNHAEKDSRRQELTAFEHTAEFADLVALRYSLLPYIYSEFMKAALHDEMYISPLAFEYPDDERAAYVEDQVMVGESLMIAPVYTQNAQGRYVYLPERMKMLRMRSPEDFDEEIMEKGEYYVSAALNEVLVFLREGHVLPLAERADRSFEVDYDNLRWISFEGDPTKYELYNDDGETPIKR